MLVRFRKPYSDSNPRMAYELLEDEIVLNWILESRSREFCYNTRLLGLVPMRKMEITTDTTDIPATVVFEVLSNM